MSNFDPIDLKGQEDFKAEQAAKKRITQEVEDQDLKWLMSGKRGRRVVWRLLSEAGVFQRTFNTNAMTMAFNEGHRDYGTQLFAAIMALCPEQFLVMQSEALNGRDGDGNGKQSN